MSIDKSWISKLRNTIAYVNGLNIFLDFAFDHGSDKIFDNNNSDSYKRHNIM